MIGLSMEPKKWMQKYPSAAVNQYRCVNQCPVLVTRGSTKEFRVSTIGRASRV